MLTALASFKDIVKVTKWTPVTENLVFKLHSRLTSLLLLVFSVLVTLDAFFGKAIQCVSTHSEEFPENFLNNYCWMHTTYTVGGAYNALVGQLVTAPGVANDHGEEKIFHSYYQWVSFFLFLSGIAFLIPNYLWKHLEGKRMEKVILDLNVLLAESESKREADVWKLAKHLHLSKGHNIGYALGHMACEIFNLIVVIGQIFLTDEFLGGEFSEYGSEVVAFGRLEFTERTDPMIRIFPRVAKCTVPKYGPTGSVQNHDAFCVLPINVVNEKIFLFLWFWYIVLAVISGMAIGYRFLLLAFDRLRLLVLRCGCRHADRYLVENLVITSSYSDWFVVRLLQRNLCQKNFCELVKKMKELADEEYQKLNGKLSLDRLLMMEYQNGDTMPIQVKNNLYAPIKITVSSGANGTHMIRA